jgi:stage V sporulation protein B
MSKAADMAKVSVKGGFHLLWGLVLSTIISSIGTIIYAKLLGSDNYGLYGIALTAPNLIGLFRDWGVNTAMIRYSAQYNAENQRDNIRRIFVAGLVFETALGLGLFIFAFGASGLMASLLNHPEIVLLIQVASFSILGSAFLNAAQAAFTGVERMELNSVTLIIQAIIRTILIPSFVIIGLSTYGAVLGYTIAFVVSGIVGLLLLWILYKNYPKPDNGKLEIKANIKMMFKYGLPLSIGSIIGGFLTQYYAVLMARYVLSSTIGNYNLALTFAVLITFFATPATTMLFPAFSKVDPEKDHDTFRNLFQYSIKYATVIVAPVAALIMALAKPGISLLFAQQYTFAPLFLAFLAIPYFYTAFGSLSTSNLMLSQGHTQTVLYFTILTTVIGVPLGFALISEIGIIGLIITTIVSPIPSIALSLLWVKRHYGATVDWPSSGKILLSSAIAAAVTYLVDSQLALSNLIILVIGVVVFVFTFIFALSLTKALNETDIASMKAMTSALGPLSKLLNAVLSIIEKIMNRLQFRKNN